MERRARIFSRQSANIVSDVKIESVVAVPFDLNVLSFRPKRLQRLNRLQRNVFLIAANKYPDLERSPDQVTGVLGLNILEVNQDEFQFQGRVYPSQFVGTAVTAPSVAVIDLFSSCL